MDMVACRVRTVLLRAAAKAYSVPVACAVCACCGCDIASPDDFCDEGCCPREAVAA